MAEAKTKTPSVTLAQLEEAGAMPLLVGNQAIGMLKPKSFSTGSYGYSYTGPALIQLPNGSVAEVQASVNLTVKHSKPKE